MQEQTLQHMPAEGEKHSVAFSEHGKDTTLQPKCAISVQQSAPALPPDLAELAGMWSALPEQVKAGILATAKALTTGGKV